MNKNKSQFEKNLDFISKTLSTTAKFGVFVGGSCIVLYALKIGHFPKEVSIGDGLLFLMAAACFGAIYILFTASLISLGITLSPLIRLIINSLKFAYEFVSNKKITPKYELVKFEWLAGLFTIFAIIFISILGAKDPRTYWQLPLLSIALYMFYSTYISTYKEIKTILATSSSAIYTKEKEQIASTHTIDEIKKIQLFSLGALLFLPLGMGGVSGQLLEATMRAAHVRIEKPIIFVQKPYSELIPIESKATGISIPKDYIAFDKTIVLFKGFGKTTVISFLDGKIERKLEIPNDKIIVEKR